MHSVHRKYECMIKKKKKTGITVKKKRNRLCAYAHFDVCYNNMYRVIPRDTAIKMNISNRLFVYIKLIHLLLQIKNTG